MRTHSSFGQVQQCLEADFHADKAFPIPEGQICLDLSALQNQVQTFEK